ncbi:pyridoxamine 5'-phosphate oxidase family protein [Caloramator sp. E03]|uniref:pyridoxamine 5'-phosphate oxidase family protein n=1 Tax=Caloramator sp. E03 TaxID=2576307 RepID=UPI0011100192|nr:pyridoxamine 5'-phosphate oxidase family protein [Caloramator sp. E03]QCX34248.1 pyridoxamine 5'-phosphate oxidase family protein [Caloramator sp. E03]
MFRELRRKDRKMEENESKIILSEGIFGVLSTIGEDGYPYGVPVNYVYKEGNIFFHSAVEGKKIDNFKFNNKVSFCVVGKADIISKKFSMAYESVIVFGRVKELEEKEKEEALFELIKKYCNDYINEGAEYIEKAKNKTKVFKIEIEHISGKKRKA